MQFLFTHQQFWFLLSVAIELIVQHIRDFLNNRNRITENPEQAYRLADGKEHSPSSSQSPTSAHGKAKNETFSHSMHRPHWMHTYLYPTSIVKTKTPDSHEPTLISHISNIRVDPHKKKWFVVKKGIEILESWLSNKQQKSVFSVFFFSGRIVFIRNTLIFS